MPVLSVVTTIDNNMAASTSLLRYESTSNNTIMEALWNIEDKWKLTTQYAILILLCTALAVIALCAAAMLKRKAQRKHVVVADQDHPAAGTSSRSSSNRDGGGSAHNWMTIRRVLMGSARWSEASKWDGGGSTTVGSWGSPETLALGPPPRLLGLELEASESSRQQQSHNSASPVWRRPILMGEKCELPRFSGLILYDERGRLLDHSLTSSQKEHSHIHKEKPGAGLITTLRDLL